MSSSQLQALKQTEQNAATGQVKTISKQINSELEVMEIFKEFGQSKDNVILLETSDIKSSNRPTADTQSKSLLMLQAAVRIECNGQQVELAALTINGNHALKQIESQLAATSNLVEQTVRETGLNRIVIEYIKNTEAADEDTKLKRSSPIDCLRVISNSFGVQQDNAYSVFLSGLFSYDLIANFEQLHEVSEGKNTCPDFVFYLAESLLVVDHKRNSKRLICNHFTTPLVSTEAQNKTYFELSRSFEKFEQQLALIPSNQPLEQDQEFSLVKAQNKTDYSVDISDKQYQQSVSKLKQNILDGDIFQVVPSRTFSIPCASPLHSYQTLKQTNPSPYLFFMQDQKFTLFGASPESALKYTQSTNHVELYPIAGTRPRGKKDNGEIDLDLDIRIEAELKLDTKEVSEHMMLVDLARNDIARISNPGSITVTKLLEVDRYSQVMHLVSNVQGDLRTDLDALHAYQACMNMGTLTGAPKLKATDLLRKTEGHRRGSYGGAVGYLNANGDMDTCIVIRSAYCADGTAHVQAGAGIVHDSVPALEAEETTHKAMAVLKAIQISNLSQEGTAA